MSVAEQAQADLERLQRARSQIQSQLSKIIVGQQEVIEQLLISIFARGHCLLEGVPGLAKTLMISSLAKTMNLSFSRIQFTPDLMPADITGTEIIEENRSTGGRERRFLEGPLFANVILADEINRTPPKTQAALLEAMQEQQITVGRVRHALQNPFFVLATQNPIEQEGTYPLPEAQLDRFMFNIKVGYPTAEEEEKILTASSSGESPEIKKILSAKAIVNLQK
ncbi:MAG: AAA family ATPase, partial [Planctomycetota bacterium]